jgi:hypothetical protein
MWLSDGYLALGRGSAGALFWLPLMMLELKGLRRPRGGMATISTVEKRSWTAGRRAIGLGINITRRLEMAGEDGHGGDWGDSRGQRPQRPPGSESGIKPSLPWPRWLARRCNDLPLVSKGCLLTMAVVVRWCDAPIPDRPIASINERMDGWVESELAAAAGQGAPGPERRRGRHLLASSSLLSLNASGLPLQKSNKSRRRLCPPPLLRPNPPAARQPIQRNAAPLCR